MIWKRENYSGSTLFLGKFPVAGVKRSMVHAEGFNCWANLGGLKEHLGSSKSFADLGAAKEYTESVIRHWIKNAGLTEVK